MMIMVARLAVALGVNLNWVFDPGQAWKLREPFWLRG
jgi:hypothetical protein